MLFFTAQPDNTNSNNFSGIELQQRTAVDPDSSRVPSSREYQQFKHSNNYDSPSILANNYDIIGNSSVYDQGNIDSGNSDVYDQGNIIFE